MRLRKRYLPLVALLGAAAAVIPSVASSSTSATVNAIGGGLYRPYWSPESAAVTPAGTVTFANESTTVSHGIVWSGGPATPTCDASIPVGKEHFEPNWSGTCTFTQAGTYTFYCSYHGPSMSGTIYVNAAGTVPIPTTTTTVPTTGTTTPPPPPTTTGQTTPPPTVSTTQPPPGGSTQTDSAGLASVPASSSTTPAEKRPPILAPLLLLAGSQHGVTVHGFTEIPATDGGARLEVDLLAKSASLARTRRAAAVRVGRFVRTSVPAGKVPFAVSLSAQAKRTLRRHGHLAVTVQVTLTPAGGAPMTSTRSVILHR